MKRSLIIILFVAWLSLCVQTTKASHTIPAGKNLFNPERVIVESDTLYTFMPFETLGGETYTLTLPGINQIDEMHISVYDQVMSYVDEANYFLQHCQTNNDNTTCTFTTHPDSTGLHISLQGQMIGMQIAHYGFEDFQLEIGSNATPYEAYIGQSPPTAPPEFQGEGTLITSYTTVLLINDIIGTYITAYDEIDGDLTDSIIITEDFYSGNEQVVGSYDVTLSVSDTSGNTALFALNIQVIDDIAPVITGPSVIHVDVDEAILLDDIILEHFTFSDDYDGAILSYEIIMDSYSQTLTELGEKSVTIRIYDHAQNMTEKTFIIHVEDNTPPVIEGPSTLWFYMSDAPNLDVFMANFTVHDNHTPASQLDLILQTHTIPDYFGFPGTYSATLYTEDASGNHAQRIVTVHIVDDIPPTIEGPALKTLSYKTPLTQSVIVQWLTVYDNVADLTHEDIIIIENHYTQNAQIPGTYKMVFEVSDGPNTTTHTLWIDVIDDVPPFFILDSRILIEQGTQMNATQLIELLMNHEDIAAKGPIHIELLNYETFHANALGIYDIEFMIIDEHNDITLHTLTVEVANIATQPESLSIVKIIVLVTLMGFIVIMVKKLKKN